MAVKDQVNYRMSDNPVTVQSDEAPEKVTELYFYPLDEANEAIAFIQPETHSFVYLGNEIQVDAVLTDDVDTTLDFGSNDQDFGKKLKMISTIDAISNKFIPVGFRDVPYFVSVGEPIVPGEYELGYHPMFYLQNFQVTKEYNEDPEAIAPEGEYTFQLLNLDVLLNMTEYKDSKITLNRVAKMSENIDSIEITTENQTLMHAVFGKGITYPTGTTGQERFGDIEFISQKPLYPMRIAPIYVDEKLILSFPWLDYDWVMPLFAARLFGNAGAGIETYVSNADDLQLVRDILLYSYMYANEFKDLPRITYPATATAQERVVYDDKYSLGSAKVQASTIMKQDPKVTIDKLITSHKQAHPAFAISRSRYQPVYQIINALSQYVYSSYATAGGNNSMHMALLPWYLEISGENGLKPTVDTSAYTITANQNTKLIVKSVYFNDTFGSPIPEHGQSALGSVSNLNMSSMKDIQTDRKISLDVITGDLEAKDSPTFPQDQTSDDMGYIVYLPLEQDNWEKLMLNSPANVVNNQPSKEIAVHVQSSFVGHAKTVQEAVSELQVQYPGSTILIPPSASPVDTTKQYKPARYPKSSGPGSLSGLYNAVNSDLYYSHIEYLDLIGDQSVRRSDTEAQLYIANKFGYDEEMIVIHHETDPNDSNYTIDFFTLKYIEFSDATIRIPAGSGAQSFGVNGREIKFDKQQFKELLFDYGFSPSSLSPTTYVEKKSWKIKKLDEIVVKAIFDESYKVKFLPSNISIDIPSISKDHEEIATKKFLFT